MLHWQCTQGYIVCVTNNTIADSICTYKNSSNRVMLVVQNYKMRSIPAFGIALHNLVENGKKLNRSALDITMVNTQLQNN